RRSTSTAASSSSPHDRGRHLPDAERCRVGAGGARRRRDRGGRRLRRRRRRRRGGDPGGGLTADGRIVVMPSSPATPPTPPTPPNPQRPWFRPSFGWV